MLLKKNVIVRFIKDFTLDDRIVCWGVPVEKKHCSCIRGLGIHILLILVVFYGAHNHLSSAGQNYSSDFLRYVGLSKVRMGCLIRPDLSEQFVGDNTCKQMKLLIISAKHTQQQNPKLFVKKIKGELQKIKTPESYRYPAILLAAVSEDKVFIEDLQRIDDLERSKHWRFNFARFAIERMSKGQCEKIEEKIYQEICEYDWTRKNK